MHTSTKVFAVILGMLFLASAAQATPWDGVRAQQMVRLAWSAYCQPQAIYNWDCYWCKDASTPKLSIVNTVVDGPTSTMGFVGFNGTNIFVIFRGTTNIKNVLVDMAIAKKAIWANVPNVKIHTGFANSWLNLGPNIMLSIRTAVMKCPTCKHVTFVGHSLGAAIATVAATEFARSNPALPFDLFTLGSPRVGNIDFSTYSTMMVPNNIRWTHANDPIPHLPMKVLGFQHRTQEIWEQGANTNYKTCSNTNGEDASCANSVLLVDPRMLSSHSNYGGVFLHSGTCDTFARSIEALSEEDRIILARAANEDLARLD